MSEGAETHVSGQGGKGVLVQLKAQEKDDEAPRPQTCPACAGNGILTGQNP
ncbi:hypothetical protein JJV70_00860 [Streptomyces sp. JJ66]|uniref:hypothetical protein n=1 Tax=Streptomyces sp. JJ66 TaxID=2803843 RepID=UPI001C561B6C|nr:hypothetical protein [Streptomyces sp. JJ66]MBW1600679.1 hypothetical protein [Streptomyces sp. JJ66]